jgi:hypothetical protein
VKAAARRGGTPSGSVTFKDGTNILGTIKLVNGRATLRTRSLTVGTHSITAVYSGDINFVTSASPELTQRVDQDGTTTKLATSARSSVLGRSVTFTVTVRAAAPGSGTPTGSVAFMNGSTVIGTGVLSAGKARFTTSVLLVGKHSIKAVYGGDAGFKTSISSVLSQTVKQ